jgi:hypothetical protein
VSRPGSGAPTRPSEIPIDRERFPRTAEYLALLPNGLASYPECSARAVIMERYARDHEKLARAPGFPAQIAAVYAGAAGSDEWIPEVVVQAAHLALRDARYPTDRALNDWTYELNRELFDKPILRSLMRLMSPTLIVVGSAKRWANFHRGTTLVAEAVRTTGGRAKTRAVVNFPENLFTRLFLESLERAFAAALAGARAKNPLVHLVESGARSARFEVTWE